MGQRTAVKEQTSMAASYDQQTPNEYDYEKPPVPSRGESRDNVTPLPDTPVTESKVQHSSNGMNEAPTINENMRGDALKSNSPLASGSLGSSTEVDHGAETYGNHHHNHGQHAVSGRPKDAPETDLETARAERSDHPGHDNDVRPAQTHAHIGSPSLLEQGEAALADSGTYNHYGVSATSQTLPSTTGGAPGTTGIPGANMPRLPSSHPEEKGTGVKWVKSTGLAADGGNFDATKPGAGREADRLLDEAGVTRTNAVHPPGTGSGSREHIEEVHHKHSLAEKLHLKKH